MARQRSTNRDAALKLWMKSGRTKKMTEIAAELGVSDALIRKWKHLDKWDEIPTKRPRGAPKGNKNAVGNKGGAPPGNTNAMKHGLYRRYLPEEMAELMKEVENLDPLDMLWQGVEMAHAKLLWAQKIMFVRDKADETKVLKKQKPGMFGTEREWEYQHAWDKQAVDISAFTKISREHRSAIKQFLNAAPDNDERRAKLEIMQAQAEKAKTESEKLKLEMADLRGDGEKDAHAQAAGYEAALNAQAEDLFADEVMDDGDPQA